MVVVMNVASSTNAHPSTRGQGLSSVLPACLTVALSLLACSCAPPLSSELTLKLKLKPAIQPTPLNPTPVMKHAAKVTPVKNKTITPSLGEASYVSFDGDSLGYKKWQGTAPPKTIIIGVHGISGHAGDYENLGKHLMAAHDDIALYAAEVRGQGMDPITHRRGDIARPHDWYRDLYTFSDLVAAQYPEAELIWFGESMGSLIVTHAYEHIPADVRRPSGLVISSPILDVKDKVAGWKRSLVRFSGMLLPKLKVSLETLSNGEKPTVTKQDIHEQQAAINPWYIRRYSLRLLLHLADMADDMTTSMGKGLTQGHIPLLVIHGGKDLFTEEQSVRAFEEDLKAHLKQSGKQNPQVIRKFYPDSYHLLMYDHDKERIFKGVSKWLRSED